MPMSIEVKGVKENLEALRQIESEAKDSVVNALREESQKVVEDAKDRVQVDTGALQRSIKRSVSKKNLSATVSAGGKTKGVDAYYAFFVEFGTKNTQPKPFLYPAARAHEEEIGERLSKEMYDLMERKIK